MSPRGLAPPADVAAAAALVVRDYMAVRAGEDVLITADTGTDLALAEALMSAVTQAGARPSLLTIPRLPFQGRAPSAVRPGDTYRDFSRADSRAARSSWTTP
jgi:hypothetical protein